MLDCGTASRILAAASAAYILWLPYHIATAPRIIAPTATRRSPSLAGALLGIANPRAWVAIGAVFASAHLTANAATDAAVKTVTLTLVIIFINTAWLIVGASLAPLLHDRRRSRVVNIALAVGLVGATALVVAYQV